MLTTKNISQEEWIKCPQCGRHKPAHQTGECTLEPIGKPK